MLVPRPKNNGMIMTANPVAQELLFYRSIRLIAVGWCAERRCDYIGWFPLKALGAKLDGKTEKEPEYDETTLGSMVDIGR